MNTRPRYLCDVDGVCADFPSAALANLREIDGSTWHHDDVTDWNYNRQIGHLSAEQQAAFWKACERKGFCADLKPYPGAIEGINALREVADVYFVTADLDESEFWLHERKEWLRQHFGATKRNRVFAYDKFTVTGDALIDDKPEHVRNWQNAHPRGLGLLWSRPYNEEAMDLHRVFNWSEVVEYAKQWRPA